MAKGNPNDDSRKLNFVARVYDPDATEDPTYGKYRPVYIAPEATSTVLGDVYLSDATDGGETAATGVTAATPAAVKKVQDNANNKLDKTTSSAQSVKSDVTFNGAITANQGIAVPSGQFFKGNLQGNASTASQLTPGAGIAVKVGAAEASNPTTFTGKGNITIQVDQVDASKVTVGTLPLSVIPQGALERVVSYESVQAAISAWTSAGSNAKPFDIGDTIRVTGVTPNVMYSVVGSPGSSSSYVEYAAGTATKALNAEEAEHAADADHADVATKLGTTTVGSGVKPIYLNSGTATASASTVGSNTKPIYMTNGALTASTADIGSSTKPIYMLDGVLTAASSTVGASNRPVYMNAGNIAQIGFTIDKSVPADAKFTDTTYSVFKGASASSAGSTGLVPAPAAGNNLKFLRGDGTWQVAGEVTGVKGNAEGSYRVGNVNLTPANIGALALSGGILTGNLASRQVAPSANNTYTLGTSSLKWSNVYATTFTGNLTGNVTGSLSGNATTATTANRLNKTLNLTGNVTGSVNLNADGTANLATTIADKAVTNGKLADDVGTVYIGANEPTEAHVKIWVKI